MSDIQNGRATPTSLEEQSLGASSSSQMFKRSTSSSSQRVEQQPGRLDQHAEESTQSRQTEQQEEVGGSDRKEKKRAQSPSLTCSRTGCKAERRDNDQTPSRDSRYALLCFRVGKHAILLEQSDMSKDAGISSDQEMFRELYSQYKKKRWRYWIRLTQLKQIEFKQVCLYPPAWK